MFSFSFEHCPHFHQTQCMCFASAMHSENIRCWICPSVVTTNFSDELCWPCVTSELFGLCYVHWTIQRWSSPIVVTTNLQDNLAVNLCPRKLTNRYRTIQWWIFSVRKLIFCHASSKITLVFHCPKTIFFIRPSEK